MKLRFELLSRNCLTILRGYEIVRLLTAELLRREISFDPERGEFPRNLVKRYKPEVEIESWVVFLVGYLRIPSPQPPRQKWKFHRRSA